MKKKAQAEAYYNLGIELIETGNYDAALDKLAQAIALDPKTGKYYSASALIYFMQGAIDTSIEYYLKAIELDPDNFNNYLYLSNIYLVKELPANSREILKKGIEKAEEKISAFPDEPYYFSILANFYYHLQYYDESIMAYYHALLIDEDNPDYYRELSNIFYELNFFEETIRLGEKAISLNPHDSSAFLYLALANQRLNLIGKSIIYLKRSLLLNPDQPEAKELLNRLNKLKKANGRTVEEIIAESKPKRKYKGKVKWFDDTKGIGFLTTPSRKSEIFVHYSSIISNGYQTLYEGEQVKFGITRSPQGPVALEVEVLNRDPMRYHYGIIQEFDYSTGHGLIKENDSEKEFPFHFSAIVGRLIKLAWINEKVCFEIMHDEENDIENAFNITFPVEKQKKVTGKIVWFDKKSGNGVIISDDGQECIIQKNSFHEDISDKLKKDIIVKFNITQVESIEGEFIPKAVDLELDK